MALPWDDVKLINRNSKSPLAIIVLTMAVGVSLAHAESLINGALEDFADGIPIGWYINPLPFPDFPGWLECTTQTSPFTNVYPKSTHSAYFPATRLPCDPVLAQDFVPLRGPFSLSFDFRLEGPATGSPWLITLGGMSNPAFYLGIQDRMFRVSDGVSYGALHYPVISLAAQIWYHVSVVANPATFTYSGFILPFGGVPVTWTRLGMHAYDGDTRLLFILGGPQVYTGIYFDNFSVTPEPPPVATLALGLLWAGLRIAANGAPKLSRVRKPACA